MIEDSDQNLKYLGLLAMSRILATHPKSVQGHKDLILQCLDDRDESIRLRALDLLYGMVSKKNLMEIVKKLMVHMDKAEGSYYRDELLSKTVEICSQSNYQYITNFEWYVSILVELTRMEGTKHGKLIANQMLDVAIRVQAIRHFAVSQMAILLENTHILANNSQRNGICEVLYAASWICGEFSEHLNDPKATLCEMLRPKVTSLPGHIQSVFVQNILKLYGKILKAAEAKEDDDEKKEVHALLQEKLPVFIQSGDLEVQERACSILQIVKYIVKLEEKGAMVADEVEGLYSGELNPVAAKAQRKVPVPEGLDLDKWINEPPDESSDEEITSSIFLGGEEQFRSSYQYESEKRTSYEPTEEEMEKKREQRKTEVELNPHYLKDSSRSKKKDHQKDTGDASDIPVAEIDLSVPLHVPGISSSDKYMLQQLKADREKRDRREKSKKKKKKGKKGRSQVSDDDEDATGAHVVSTVVDAPEGMDGSDKDEDKNANDAYKALDINLDEPLRDDEKLPVRTHHVVSNKMSDEQDDADKPKKKHKKEREKKDKKGKKEKKKSKKSENTNNGPSLLISETKEEKEDTKAADVQLDDAQVEKDSEETKTTKESESDDLSFWLSKDEPSLAPSESIPEEPVVQNGLSETPSASPASTRPRVAVENVVLSSEEEQAHIEEKSKKKKEKKSKKDKHQKKKEKKKLKEKRSEYEEAEGITTPSKEATSDLEEVKIPTMSSYQLLAENSAIKLTYEARINPQRSDQVIVSVVFSNLTDNKIKDLEFSVLDTLNTKLQRGMGQSSHDPVKVPFVLLPQAQNEGQFAFSVDNITMPQKLRGTLTYILKTEDGSTQDKVDFKIALPCSTYLVATASSSEEFATLLSSGDVEEKNSVKLEPSDSHLSVILAKVCFYLHFRVVEQVERSASLFSRSTQGHPVCLLVKMNEGSLSVEGKSSNSVFLSNVLDDVKNVLTQPS